MNAELLTFAGVCIVALSLILIPCVSARFRPYIALAVISIHAILTSVSCRFRNPGTIFPVHAGRGYNLGQVAFAIDPLSAWFILIVNITLVNGTLYGIGYMKPYAERKSSLSLHWILLVLFHASMLWVCHAPKQPRISYHLGDHDPDLLPPRHVRAGFQNR